MSAAEPTAREERLNECLQGILARPDVPAFSEAIQETIRVANSTDGSIRRLTDIALGDVSLTLKILRTANSAYYNRSGRSILSVTHAAALLGVEALRHIASSLILFEHFKKKSPALREVLLLALLTACHAREAAIRSGYPRPEEAYLCGMFRNIGEVLIACYLPREYALILAAMKEERLDDRHGSLKILGFTFEELGQRIAEHWGIPAQITRCIVSTNHPAGAFSGHSEEAQLSLLATFGHCLTTALHRSIEGGRQRLNSQLEEAAKLLAFTPKDLKEIAASAIRETRETFRRHSIPLDDLKLQKQLQKAIAALTGETLPGEDSDEQPDGPLRHHLLAKLAAEMEAILASAQPFDLSQMLMMGVEAIYRGGPFDRVILALRSPDQKTMVGRFGLGAQVERFLRQFEIPLTLRGGPFAASLLRGEDTFLTRDRPPTFGGIDLVKQLVAPCCGLLPVMVDGNLAGCLYFDRNHPAPLDFNAAETLPHLKRVRDLTVQAIRQARPRRDPALG